MTPLSNALGEGNIGVYALTSAVEDLGYIVCDIFSQHKNQTPLLPLSGTGKVVRTPTNPFEVVASGEVYFPKEIIVRRIQEIYVDPNT